MKNLHAKKTDKNAFVAAGIFSSALFITASAVYLYSPTFGSHAAESKEAEVSLTVSSALGLRTSADNLNLEANVGDFVHGAINVDVLTNSQYGYTLTLEDSDDESSLIHSNSTVSDKLISDFEGAKTSSAMDDNTWGFSLDESSYYFIPTLGNPVALKRTNSVHSGYDTTAVDFGAKVGATLTAGTYADTVKFTAYVNGVDGAPSGSNNGGGSGSGSGGSSSSGSSINISEPGVKPAKVGDFHTITTMQQMTPAICAATTTPLATAAEFDWDGSHAGNAFYVQRAILTDTRDNKKYIISKLADGNCWMSQNLALNLEANQPIIISNNDGTTSTATPNNTTQTTYGATWVMADNNWRSYTPKSGDDYFRGGTQQSDSPTSSWEGYGWESAGNYYNWYAATGGTGDSAMFDEDAPSSICPLGWRLPTYRGEKSLYKLINTTYGLNMLGIGDTPTIRKDPLNFVSSGAYDFGYGVMRNLGQYGFYWSSTASDTDNKQAYHFMFGPAAYEETNYKGYGFSVRCVAI